MPSSHEPRQHLFKLFFRLQALVPCGLQIAHGLIDGRQIVLNDLFDVERNVEVVVILLQLVSVGDFYIVFDIYCYPT